MPKLYRKLSPILCQKIMSRKFYSWPDLVQLYRDADVIAVCLVDNKYAAGVQGLLEAMACK
jgi:hypothetical protein